jgi:hypothetical protein
MATLTKGKTFTTNEVVTPTKLNDLVDKATIRDIVNTDISTSAAISDTKLATISTAGKVSGTAITSGNIVTSGNITTTGTLTAGTLSFSNQLVPVGAVLPFVMTTAPFGWLPANGQTIGSAASGANFANDIYSALYSVLWLNWTNSLLPILTSAGLASTRGTSASADFAAGKRLPLPDLRGYFVRGSGTNSDGTASGTFGAKQTDEFEAHNHSFSNSSYAAWTDGGNNEQYTFTQFGSGIGKGTIQNTGGTETRPKNIALLYCIKA